MYQNYTGIEMIKRRGFALWCAIALGMVTFSSCTVGSVDKERVDSARNIVINELMANNRTGLMNDNREPADWIEIKNRSNDSINLEGFELAVIRKKKEGKPAKENSKQKEDSPDEEILTWEFPD
ncbi:MAG: lamin tail domain-containing protein, partial [Muribaculaceae bacterium]|nr:lamin tail domain-containing protein [Muribaculaceae bacterium]